MSENYDRTALKSLLWYNKYGRCYMDKPFPPNAYQRARRLFEYSYFKESEDLIKKHEIALNSELVSKEEKVPIGERILDDYKQKLSVVRCQLNMCPSKEEKIDNKQEKLEKRKKIWVDDIRKVRFRAGVEAQALENLKRQQERKKWTLPDMFLENETETNTIGWKCDEGLEGKLVKPKVPKSSEIRKSRIPNLLFDKPL